MNGVNQKLNSSRVINEYQIPTPCINE